MRSVLIIQTAFIGDVVLSTSLVEKLHLHYPNASIDFLLRNGNEGLLDGHPFIREVMVWDKQRQKAANKFRLLREIRGRQYDVVVNVQRFLATGSLTAFSGAKERIGFDRNPLSRFFDLRIPYRLPGQAGSEHEVDRNQRLIAHLTDANTARPRLYPSAEDLASMETYRTGPYVCVAPASVRHTKTYPASKWISFINRIPQQFSILLIGSSDDHAMCEHIRMQADMPGRISNLAGSLSLLRSAALLSGAAMNYANDSAPLHMASAMNAPVTAIFCSTVPSFGFGPLSDISHVVQAELPLSCRPCGDHGRNTCPRGHFNCALQVRDEQLLDTLPAI